MRFSRLCPFLLVLAVGVFGRPAAHAQFEEANEVPSPDAVVYVDGLACPFCAYGLEKKMNRLAALRAMEVQLEKGRVLLLFEKGQTMTKKEIRNAVKRAGFTARKIEFADDFTS